MIGQASLRESLQALPRDEFEQELRGVLDDSLQDLVAAVEQAARGRGHFLRSCVIDDYRITRARWIAGECIVLLFYHASAQYGDSSAGVNDRIFGSAVLAVDEGCRVTYKGVTFNEDRVFEAPDVGGGD